MTASSALATFGLVVAVGSLAASATSQTPRDAFEASAAEQPLRFEVASVKLMRRTAGETAGPSAEPIAPAGRPTSRFNFTGAVRNMIERAYGVSHVQQIGGPDWIRREPYTIVATIPEGIANTPANTNVMIRSLLADRFKLVMRDETRELPVFALVHARGDRALGPHLKPVAAECLLPGNTCSRRAITNRGSIEFRNQPLLELVRELEFGVNRPIVDRTGLAGHYDLSVKYSEDPLAAAGVSELPSLFTALQEQLGLRLVSTRAPVKVLVIDSIERPTED
jgi:uncharacterized protein (TIGR03435 family)